MKQISNNNLEDELLDNLNEEVSNVEIADDKVESDTDNLDGDDNTLYDLSQNISLNNFSVNYSYNPNMSYSTFVGGNIETISDSFFFNKKVLFVEDGSVKQVKRVYAYNNTRYIELDDGKVFLENDFIDSINYADIIILDENSNTISLDLLKKNLALTSLSVSTEGTVNNKLTSSSEESSDKFKIFDSIRKTKMKLKIEVDNFISKRDFMLLKKIFVNYDNLLEDLVNYIIENNDLKKLLYNSLREYYKIEEKKL